MKRRLFLLLSLMAALILSACGEAAAPTATTAPATEPTKAADATKAPEATKAADATKAPEPTTAPAGGSISGKVVIWHGYHTGEVEEKVFLSLIEKAKKDNPGLEVEVLAVPFDQLFNKFETESAAGGGPDMFIAPNDSLGKEVRAGLLAEVDEYLKDRQGDTLEVALNGVKVDGKSYAIPESLKAVAMFYNKSTVKTVPTTTDELLAAVKGGLKLGLNANAYHSFGFFGAFGGKLLDDTGKCVADQGGFADALQYMLDLKAAGATLYTDGGKLDDDFKTGKLDAIVEGPWMTGVFKAELKDNLGVAAIPAGPKGAAAPLTGVDGFYINSSAANKEGAVALALYLTSEESQTVLSNEAGHIPANKNIAIKDEVTKGFAVAVATGYPRPQVAELDNYWGNFGDAVTKVNEGALSPADAVTKACADMNKANNK